MPSGRTWRSFLEADDREACCCGTLWCHERSILFSGLPVASFEFTASPGAYAIV
jgi:hypothetical protein